jgi:hypothetical protein
MNPDSPVRPQKIFIVNLRCDPTFELGSGIGFTSLLKFLVDHNKYQLRLKPQEFLTAREGLFSPILRQGLKKHNFRFFGAGKYETSRKGNTRARHDWHTFSCFCSQDYFVTNFFVH